MALIDAVLDRYTLFARQRPALLMIFPLVVAVVVIFPTLQTWWATLLAVTGTCGVAVALAEFAQSKGKRAEPDLVKLWGGLPSVAMLRYRDSRIDPVTKERYKAFLQSAVHGLRFPDESLEIRDPIGADDIYHSATRWLLSQTRDKKVFALLFQQNISYGFRRNLYGLRHYGTALAVMASLVVAASEFRSFLLSRTVGGEIVVSELISVVALFFWLAIVRPGWVLIAANGYAAELLAACDRLASASARSRP